MELGLYSLDWEAVGDAGTARALDALLAWHEDALGRAFVDAVTAETPLPPDVAAAQDELAALGRSQAMQRLPRRSLLGRVLPDLSGDPLVAVELQLGRPRDLELFRGFALYSTAAVVCLRDDETPEIEIYDSGQSFEFFADEALLQELTTRAGIPPGALHRAG